MTVGESAFPLHILTKEQRAAERLVAENRRFLAFVPFFVRQPSEVLICSRRRIASLLLSDLAGAKRRDPPETISVTRRKYDDLDGFPIPLVTLVFRGPVCCGHTASVAKPVSIRFSAVPGDSSTWPAAKATSIPSRGYIP